MSLIREALKKAGDGKEPALLMPEKEGKKKKSKSLQFIKYGALIFLLLGLAGALAYLFLPGSIPSSIKTPVPPSPQVMVKKVQKKSQEVTLATGIDSSPQINLQKVETKGPPPTSGKEPTEKELAQKSERLFKALSPRLISPRPTAKTTSRPSLPTQRVTKTKPPGEVPEPASVQATPEGADSL
ncbi:MAG: hypothetical protein C0407_11560, partial [Desulfobacca sp.]|nr:hypothetical protein [Desulfobacca sp.]